MLPDAIIHLLRTQFGLVARHQIRAMEPYREARRALYRHPELEAVTDRVLRHRAVRPCPEQSVMVGVLDAGPNAILWGKSSATHWGFGRERLLPPHIAVPRSNRKGGHLGQVHVVSSLDACDRTVHNDIPTSRPEATVLWLAGMLTHRFGHEVAFTRTEVVLDHAWRQRLIHGQYIHDLADRCGGRGRSGIVVLRQALETRPPSYQPAGSRLEERFESNLTSRVRDDLERQITVDVEPVIRTVDYRARSWPLVVEINGEPFHTSLTDRSADSERYEHLLSNGFSVAVFWEYDIWHDSSTVRWALDRIHRHPDAVPTLHRPTKAPWEW